MPKKQKEEQPSAIGVIYARYSSHNQKEESIEQQVEECMAFAAANNIKIIHVYPDRATTGRSDKRKEFQRMMRDAEKKEFSVVVAYKSNRIARNMLNALQYEAKLDLWGIRTLYAKEEFGNTAAGRFALRTMMNVNQFYSENMAEDIRRGMADNAANCKVNGALPLGYVKGADGRYEISPREAAIVREIYSSFLEDIPLIDIARSLNSRGIKTKQGNEWNKGSFHRMLSNDNYIGVYRHSSVVVEGGIPPIITEEDFAKVQEKLVSKKNPIGRHRENGDYLLTGKLYCGHCKSRMVGVSGKTRDDKPLYYYYQCQKRRTDKSCDKKNVRREWIERLVVEKTQEFILSRDDVVEWIADSAVDLQMKSRRGLNISSIEREIAEKKKAAKNIMTAIENGIFTETTRDRLIEIESSIKELNTSLLLAKAADKPLDKERVIYSLEQLRDGSVEDPAYVRMLIDIFVKAVYLWDDRIEIDYYYTGKKNRIKFDIGENNEEGASSDGPIGEVRISAPDLHHKGTAAMIQIAAVPFNFAYEYPERSTEIDDFRASLL